MLTTKQISEHLKMSERNVYEILKNLGIDRKTATMQEVRIAYILDLREKAAGRGGSMQESLSVARTEEAQMKTALNRLAYHEKLGTLVLANDAGYALNDWAAYANREYLSGIEKLVSSIEDETDISVSRKTVDNIVIPMLERIQQYAKKLGDGLINRSK